MAQGIPTEGDNTRQQTIKELSAASSLSFPDVAEVASLVSNLRMFDDGKPYGSSVSSSTGNFNQPDPNLGKN
jgi:hypothetical protein